MSGYSIQWYLENDTQNRTHTQDVFNIIGCFFNKFKEKIWYQIIRTGGEGKFRNSDIYSPFTHIKCVLCP